MPAPRSPSMPGMQAAHRTRHEQSACEPRHGRLHRAPRTCWSTARRSACIHTLISRRCPPWRCQVDTSTTSSTTRRRRACSATRPRRAASRLAASRCWSARRGSSSAAGRERASRPASCAPQPSGNSRSSSPMKITSFEEFKDLARRGTFVPVCKELVADLLTPVSAFLKIAEDADYAFLLESVEGGEHVGRYSFLGKDPFLILRARGGRTTLERGGTVTESDRPFIDTLRGLMADFRSPFVPDLPRFTGGAVGYLGYGAASWFEPVLGDLGAATDGSDQAGFMLFDTVLAFDHVQHRILIIANAPITAADDLAASYQFECTKIPFP